MLARPFSFFYNLLAEIIQNEFDCTERIDLRYECRLPLLFWFAPETAHALDDRTTHRCTGLGLA